MSVHQFVPPHNFFVNHIDYVWELGAFSDEELSQIEKIGDSLAVQTNAGVENGTGEVIYDNSIRKCKTSWMPKTPETQFIYERLAKFIEYANARYYDFNLFGFVENFQYTVYDSKDDHFDWHVDLTKKGNIPYRKLSLILQLSDPNDYEGGNLELFASNQPTTLEKKKGIIHLFPSYLLHRVTPVTKGVRKTLVVWVNGERFR